MEALEGQSDKVRSRGCIPGVTESASLATPPVCVEQAVMEIGLRMEPSDESLMQGIAARDSRALDQLHARYQTLVRKIISPILSNQADAEETLHDVFTEIWTRADRFDGRRGKPLGWIICMARRRAIDHLRRIRSRAEAREKLQPSKSRTRNKSSMARPRNRPARMTWKRAI